MVEGHPLIGITGGIASGKSTVATFLREQGYPVINADRLGHQILLKGQPGYQPVLDCFGQGILQENEEIDRQKLGSIIFNDACARQQLNQITHPLIAQRIERHLQELAEHFPHGTPIFLEAALLIESRWRERCDQIWVVLAPKERALERLQQRNGFTLEQAQARINSQLLPEERLPYASVVLENQENVESLFTQVKTALRLLSTQEAR